MRKIATCVTLLGAISICGAASASPQADSFANIYASICLKHLANLDELRAKLKDMPELPPEKAGRFLQNMDGNAWPVPDRNGVFVVAVPKGKNLCSVFARRVDAQAAEEKFMSLVQKAPAPLVSRLATDERGQGSPSGATKTISYEWSAPQAKRKMLFMLTTSTGESADIQGLATASLVQ
jgi:hypothetical protein